MQSVVFEIFTSAYYATFQEKTRFYLLRKYMKKNITESRDRLNFESGAICNLHLCYNFASVYYENALVFSQSEARNFLHVHHYM